MADKPIPIVVGAVVTRKRILLIKRKTGNYKGYWALPGGKVEKDEHLSAAAVREIKEEAGIDCTFTELFGIVSEHFKEADNLIEHFLINFCELKAKSSKLQHSDEGIVEWFSLEKLKYMKQKLVPSDFEMIEKMLLKSEGRYFDCLMENVDGKLVLKKFEKLS